MSVGAYHDVRSCYTESTPNLGTYRYVVIVYQAGSERFVEVQYRESVTSARKMLCEQNVHFTERWCFKPKVVYTYDDNKVCYTPAAEVNFALRYCTYSLGSSNIIYTLPAQLAITYIAERKCFVEKNIVSNRFVCIRYEVESERVTQCCIREETKVNTPLVQFGLKVHSERQIFYVIGDYSQRQISVKYTLANERTLLASLVQQTRIYAPKVQTTIAGLVSTRTCIVGESIVHSDRLCWFITSQLTERQITLRYMAASERQITFYIGRVNDVYTFIATPSRLVPSERFIFCWSFAYYSERACFAEMRPLWFEKAPLGSSPILNVRSKLDTDAQVKIMNDRPLELAGLTGTVEDQNSITKHTVINQTKDNYLRISAVDNTGALINTFADDKQRKLAFSQVFEVIVSDELVGGGANNTSSVTFDGGDANNDSGTEVDGDV